MRSRDEEERRRRRSHYTPNCSALLRCGLCCTDSVKTAFINVLTPSPSSSPLPLFPSSPLPLFFPGPCPATSAPQAMNASPEPATQPSALLVPPPKAAQNSAPPAPSAPSPPPPATPPAPVVRVDRSAPPPPSPPWCVARDRSPRHMDRPCVSRARRGLRPTCTVSHAKCAPRASPATTRRSHPSSAPVGRIAPGVKSPHHVIRAQRGTGARSSRRPPSYAPKDSTSPCVSPRVSPCVPVSKCPSVLNILSLSPLSLVLSHPPTHPLSHRYTEKGRAMCFDCPKGFGCGMMYVQRNSINPLCYWRRPK